MTSISSIHTETAVGALVAIDIAVEPDATMMQRAMADNARLLKNFPKGYTLDETHHAHVSVLQRFVRKADLEKVYAGVAEVAARENPLTWKLKAVKYYYLPAAPIGLAGIVVEPTADLLRFQQELIDAVAPYAVKTATAAAFFTTAAEPDVNQPTIDYIAAYVPDHSGKNFMPHVTIGVGTIDYLNKLLAEPFDAFTFSPAGASVYQLGNYGTARKQLKNLDFKP